LKHADGALGVSKALVAKMVALGANKDTTRELGNGVDTELFRPENRLTARQALGIPEDAQMVLTVAALIPLKGHRFLISAISELAPKYPKLMVYCAGSGSELHHLEQQVKAAGLQDRIKFAGQRPYDELRLWYSAADVSCLASSREGWPNVLLESLACGTPVVATDVGAVTEILVSPDLGIVVQQDSAALARGLAEALDRRWDRTLIAQHARARTWATVAQELEIALRDFSGKHLTKKNSH
jgi:glycosyltransferase involved in cell wall biosynthesis